MSGEPHMHIADARSFRIDKGIPIPRARGGVKAGVKRGSRWDLLDVGDSVLVLDDYASRNAAAWARANGRQFTQRKVAGGWRIWRTA